MPALKECQQRNLLLAAYARAIGRLTTAIYALSHEIGGGQSLAYDTLAELIEDAKEECVRRRLEFQRHARRHGCALFEPTN